MSNLQCNEMEIGKKWEMNYSCQISLNNFEKMLDKLEEKQYIFIYLSVSYIYQNTLIISAPPSSLQSLLNFPYWAPSQ